MNQPPLFIVGYFYKLFVEFRIEILEVLRIQIGLYFLQRLAEF